MDDSDCNTSVADVVILDVKQRNKEYILKIVAPNTLSKMVNEFIGSDTHFAGVRLKRSTVPKVETISGKSRIENERNK